MPKEDLEVLSAAVVHVLDDANCYTRRAASEAILQLLDARSRQSVIGLLCVGLEDIVLKEDWQLCFDLLSKLAGHANGREIDMLVGSLLPLLKARNPDVTLGSTLGPPCKMLWLVLGAFAAGSLVHSSKNDRSRA